MFKCNSCGKYVFITTKCYVFRINAARCNPQKTQGQRTLFGQDDVSIYVVWYYICRSLLDDSWYGWCKSLNPNELKLFLQRYLLKL